MFMELYEKNLKKGLHFLKMCYYIYFFCKKMDYKRGYKRATQGKKGLQI